MCGSVVTCISVCAMYRYSAISMDKRWKRRHCIVSVNKLFCKLIKILLDHKVTSTHGISVCYLHWLMSYIYKKTCLEVKMLQIAVIGLCTMFLT